MLVCLLPAAVIGAAVGLAAAANPGAATSGIIWCGLVGAAAVAVAGYEAVRRGRALELAREEAARQDAEQRHRLARQQAGMLELARNELPQAVARMQGGEFITDVLRSYEQQHVNNAGDEFHDFRYAVLRAVLDAVDNEEAMRESAQRAFVNIARRVQAIVHRQAIDLRKMEDRHGDDPAVFDDLLLLDHGNALIGRLADSIAVLGGARPGRQWNNPVPLYSVLRGGISRILDFRRVELHPVSEVAVVGPAVEPLIHALAELLDNATRYSPPQTNVHLTAVEVQTGIAIEIEDGGLSLGEEGRARAERMLAEAESGIDLNGLGEAPRLGLAVVGRLARAYGFQVSLRPSAYGGVRAVLIVPEAYITTAPAPSRAHGIGRIATTTPLAFPSPQGPGGQYDGEPYPPVPGAEFADTAPRPHPAAATHTPAGGFAATAAFPASAAFPAPAASAAGTFPAPSDGTFPRTVPAAASGPASAAASPAGPGPAAKPYEDDAPQVFERTANGLPQRRRHAAPSRFGASRPAQQAPARTPAPAQAPAPPVRAAAAPQAPVPAPAPAPEPVQPGLWLAAFTDGVNGTAPVAGPGGGSVAGPGGGSHASDESAGKGDK
ncbi:signal transduction histidine kinase [Kitasatospora sp. SolWspMP-SS2h]|uniref:sensor histidine kinase n=1 Tax=Kitasatospora sp. SolWspMP-SS2h TaxID=1305729 RepID=UPI000DC0463E|nr:signal transduction histidine kinase [Kitasatospora sp. SolWspMP-SS2h]